MHNVSIRPEIVDRVMARRGRLHWFNSLNPKSTALIVIDMQDTFCAPGGPGEVAVSRAIVEPINKLTRQLRPLGVPVIWVLHANSQFGSKSDWEMFFDHVVADDVRAKTVESLAPGRQSVWGALEQGNDDITLFKNRYSALISGSSQLERVLRSMGIDTLLIADTKTNVCCEFDRTRRHDARLQGGDAVGLHGGFVGRRTPRRAGDHHPTVRRCADRG